MFNELERLRDVSGLRDLLDHYAGLAGPDRLVWQDRLLTLGLVAGRDLSRLHGELLAYGWLEQNTGVTPTARKGEAPACYRVTPVGVRALKRFRAGELDEE
jgi:hypothetical protein